MIEQTDLEVIEWKYTPPVLPIEDPAKVLHAVDLQVQQKRTSEKKGIACRYSVHFVIDTETILIYTGEDTYVIDLEDVVDRQELITMLRNSFSKFNEKFEFKKLGTILHDKFIQVINVTDFDLDPILPLLA